MIEEILLVERAAFERIEADLDVYLRDGWHLASATRSGESEVTMKLRRARPATPESR